ncbi:MAG: DUF2796 domain-containing protein [Rubrivivax sp.]|nr:DUF2796 domain-containing protein [Rubrivivax sp.]
MHRSTQPHSLFGGLLLLMALASAAAVMAKKGAHVHGLVKLDVAVQAKTLTVQIQAPLDSLLGFEHRPRTAAQKQAADAVLKQMNDGARLIRPPAAALCKAGKVTVESETLQATAAAAGTGARDDGHADLDATYEFTCEQPDKLGSIEIGLFEAFKRIQTIEVQVAGANRQSKVTLKRPDKMLRLGR